MLWFLIVVLPLVTFMLGVLAERWRWGKAIRPFETPMRCCECGGQMHLPISLWRCVSGKPDHEMTGPGIGFEIRNRLSPTRHDPPER